MEGYDIQQWASCCVLAEVVRCMIYKRGLLLDANGMECCDGIAFAVRVDQVSGFELRYD